ncbi:MAG: geranylgeranyl reductase family protein [Acidimicrobiia bacterium]|nr:geranylgeranyl reductase family protein [Acidimicrobiia bacterium]
MTQPRRCDLLVVGAGPAGTAAAISAQDRGLHVEVVDRATFPRDKTCGDGLTTAALRHLERLGVPRSSLAGIVPVHETVLVSPSGRRVTLSFPDNGLYAGVIAREELDAVLVEFARSRGVVVHEGAPVVNVTNEAARVTVSCADGSHFEASWVVAADGNYSTVRRILEPTGERRLGTSHAFRQYFHGVDDPRLWVVFEPDLLPGYAWVFPLPGGRANVGFGVRRTSATSGKQLNALWRDLMRRPSIREILGAGEPEGAPRAWPIPGDLDAAALSDGRILYVGDAAGTVDPLTGEGIAQAIETGILAAHSVADSVADAAAVDGSPTDVAERYERAVGAALRSDARMATAVQRVLSSPLLARAALRAVDSTEWTRRNFARWMFEDYPRALLVTPRRWHRGALSGAGAYRT